MTSSVLATSGILVRELGAPGFAILALFGLIISLTLELQRNTVLRHLSDDFRSGISQQMIFSGLTLLVILIVMAAALSAIDVDSRTIIAALIGLTGTLQLKAFLRIAILNQRSGHLLATFELIHALLTPLFVIAASMGMSSGLSVSAAAWALTSSCIVTCGIGIRFLLRGDKNTPHHTRSGIRQHHSRRWGSANALLAWTREAIPFLLVTALLGLEVGALYKVLEILAFSLWQYVRALIAQSWVRWLCVFSAGALVVVTDGMLEPLFRLEPDLPTGSTAVLMVALLVSASTSTRSPASAEQPWAAPAAQLVGLAALAVLAFPLTGTFGLPGAAISTLVASLGDRMTRIAMRRKTASITGQ